MLVRHTAGVPSSHADSCPPSFAPSPKVSPEPGSHLVSTARLPTREVGHAWSTGVAFDDYNAMQRCSRPLHFFHAPSLKDFESSLSSPGTPRLPTEEDPLHIRTRPLGDSSLYRNQ